MIEIKEYNDIRALREGETYLLKYNSQTFSFTKNELLEIDEFNSGVYAFRYKYLRDLIGKLESNNVQNEIYITDLISLFNQNNLTKLLKCILIMIKKIKIKIKIKWLIGFNGIRKFATKFIKVFFYL